MIGYASNTGTVRNLDALRAAVTIDWSDGNQRGHMDDSGTLRKPGEIVRACVEPTCKAHLKDYAGPQRSQREERVRPESTEKLAAQREFLERTETALRRELLYTVIAKLDAGAALRAVSETHGNAPEWRKFLLAKLPKLSPERLEALTLYCCEFGEGFRARGYQLLRDCRLNSDGTFDAAKERPNVAADREGAWKLAKQAGVDADEFAVRYFAAVGIAPAADVLYPQGPKAEKAWKKLRAERDAALNAKPAKKAAAKPARKAVRK